MGNDMVNFAKNIEEALADSLIHLWSPKVGGVI